MIASATLSMPHFGDWLLAARKSAELSQEVLADKAGISKNYVSVLERNLPNYKTGALPNPSRKVLADIATALNLPKSEVFQAWARYGNGTDENDLTYEAVEDEDEAISYYRGISEDLRPAALAQLRILYEADKRRAANEEPKTFGKRPNKSEE